ncbi:DnaD domain-containing protein [Marinococcus halophilus]|uniref:DnaD domain-containing protein n=1 Tax=Marinococcus halophilus TaxID=1371 RepID=UPI0009A873FD|nr:DnaD domain protein [Marinococcus halophilus]
MSKHQELRAIMKKMSGQDSIITVPRIFIEYLEGDLNTALVLNQLVFYADKTKRTDGFFYKSYGEWEAETGLTRRKIKGSIDKLVNKELVTTKLKKANGAPTLHYALDYDKMLASITAKCANPSEQSVTNPDSDKVSDSITDDLQLNSTNELNSSRQAFVSVVPFYQENFSGIMTAYHRERLDDWGEALSPEVVLRALEITILQGGRSLKYAEQILNDWQRFGCRTLDDVENYEKTKKQQKEARRHGRSSPRHARGTRQSRKEISGNEKQSTLGNGWYRPGS